VVELAFGGAPARSEPARSEPAALATPEGPQEIVDAARQELEYPGDQTDEG
jgi:hypothetical protein